MTHTELNLRERRVIEDMLNAKMSVSKIAAEIGRHPSTIYRDIKRNGFVDSELPKLSGYYGMVAQKTAAQRRARRRKLVRLVDLRKAVIAQLKEGWSPEQIAGRLRPCCIDQWQRRTRPTQDGIQAVRSKLGRPSSVIQLRTRTPILASVFWFSKPRAFSLGPIISFQRPMRVSPRLR